jgi:hypothetical protein
LNEASTVAAMFPRYNQSLRHNRNSIRPALRIGLEILPRGVQFNLRSKGDPQ